MARSVLLALLFCASAVYAEPLKLAVHPVYSEHQVSAVFEPLAAYLSQELGQDIEIITSSDFHRYAKQIKNHSGFDLVFDDAHIAAYRMKHHGFTPIVKIQEPASYSLLVMDDNKFRHHSDLVNYRVVTLPSPSISFSILNGLYPDVFQSPSIHSEAIAWLDGIEMVFAGEMDATIAPQYLVERYPNLIPVYTSGNFPGATLSAAPGLSPLVREKVSQAMLKLHHQQEYFSALNELNTKAFVAANVNEYQGLTNLLTLY